MGSSRNRHYGVRRFRDRGLLKQIFDAVGKPKQYLWINGKLDKSSLEMDDASKENLAALKKDGEKLVHQFDKELDEFVDLLIR